jgi:hypothetical protein
MHHHRLPTTAEKADLARLLAQQHPHYPFLTPVEMVRAVEAVYQAAIAVVDDDGRRGKRMFVRWNQQNVLVRLAWVDGQLLPAAQAVA